MHANGISSSEIGNTGHCEIDFLKVGRKSKVSVNFFKSENDRNVWISLERGNRGALLGSLGAKGNGNIRDWVGGGYKGRVMKEKSW